MNIKKNIVAVGIIGSILASSLSNINAYSQPTLEKIAGKDNYETAALVADRQNYTSAILVNLDNSIADGLSSSGLSGATNSPILLTKKDSIPTSTLERLSKVKNIYIIGGVNSVSPKVESTLKSKGMNITRISGSNRIETSLNVAKEVKKFSKAEVILLTNGFKGEPDAISAAAVAAREKGVIILTDGQNTTYEINSNYVYAIGGKSSISDSLVNRYDAIRLGGKDRFDTNAKVIESFYTGGDEINETAEFHVADGRNLVNALVSAPIAKNKPVVIVANNSDKRTLEDSSKITVVGNLDQAVINQCLDPIPVIRDIIGTWKIGYDELSIGLYDFDGEEYSINKVDKSKNIAYITVHTDKRDYSYTLTLNGNKLNVYNPEGRGSGNYTRLY